MNKERAEEIKPCPFCGWNMQNEYECHNQNTDPEGDEPRFIICCPDCVASACPATTWEEALKNWNRRAASQSGNITSESSGLYRFAKEILCIS